MLFMLLEVEVVSELQEVVNHQYVWYKFPQLANLVHLISNIVLRTCVLVIYGLVLLDLNRISIRVSW
jgi:hypothetical protein